MTITTLEDEASWVEDLTYLLPSVVPYSDNDYEVDSIHDLQSKCSYIPHVGAEIHHAFCDKIENQARLPELTEYEFENNMLYELTSFKSTYEDYKNE